CGTRRTAPCRQLTTRFLSTYRISRHLRAYSCVGGEKSCRWRGGAQSAQSLGAELPSGAVLSPWRGAQGVRCTAASELATRNVNVSWRYRLTFSASCES